MHALTTIALAAAEAATKSPASGSFWPSIWAFVLLVVSLIVFIISTRQWPLLQRSLIWLGGMLALFISVFVSNAVGGGRFISVLATLSKDSGVLGTIGQNFGSVTGYFEPALNALFVLCIVAGVVALIAFTPGEGIERNLRRFSLIVVGTIIGAILTLTLVAFGFGGNAKRLVFVGIPSLVNCEKYEKSQRDPLCDVVDGDTFRMGDISLRIAGINTPEMDDRCEFATCKVGNGEAARAELVKLLAGRVVVCAGARKVADTDKEESKKARPPVESLGRPVVECRVWLKDSRPIELGPEMVKSGYGRACRKGGSVDDAYWIDIIAAHLTSQDASDGPSRTSLSCPKGEYDADGKKGGPSG